MISLGDRFPKEQARCREALKAYEEIGPAGAFGAMLIRLVLERADKAAISGDVAEMIAVFQEMVEVK